MHELLDRIGEIAERIKSLESNRERLGRFLKDVKDKVCISGKGIMEERLVYRVEPDKLEERKIIAVDGGLSQHEYHGLDIILTRAVAVVCNFSAGRLQDVGYYPSAIVAPRIETVSDPYSDEEFAISSCLERQRTEIELASKVFLKFCPDIVLLDGSVVPHGNDRPSKSSGAYKRYENVLESFRNLYRASRGKLLAGCVEDSRGRRFCEIVSEKILGEIDSPLIPELQKILNGTRDTNLLYHVLEKGERSCVFRFSKNPKEHPVLSDLGLFGERIYSFYLKTAEFDRPVRIDFYAEDNVIEVAEKIAGIVLATSCNNSYGCPAPLIEADFRAKLQERDVDSLHDQLVDRVGITPSLMKLRREQRPF